MPFFANSLRLPLSFESVDQQEESAKLTILHLGILYIHLFASFFHLLFDVAVYLFLHVVAIF